ncbi:MAG TPA: hypothetical protein DHM90_10025 [Clostridiaceae bacterium]|nr:hypothetical protein [Clostridiaceae bacterium]
MKIFHDVSGNCCIVDFRLQGDVDLLEIREIFKICKGFQGSVSCVFLAIVFEAVLIEMDNALLGIPLPARNRNSSDATEMEVKDSRSEGKISSLPSSFLTSLSKTASKKTTGSV